MADDAVTLHQGTVKDWITWATRGAIGALFTGLLATITWANDANNRLHDVEQNGARIAKLEARDEGFGALTTEIAVLKAKLDAQDRQLSHITQLLESSR